MKFKKIFKIWDMLEIYISGILLIIATGFAFYQVVMRYAFNSAPEWAEESVLYLIIWAVFIISSTLARDNAHVGANFFIRKMPHKLQRSVEIINTLFALFFCGLVIWYGFKIVAVTIALDERSTTRLRFPMWLAYSAVPAGCCLTFLSYFRRLYLIFFPSAPNNPPSRCHQGENIGE